MKNIKKKKLTIDNNDFKTKIIKNVIILKRHAHEFDEYKIMNETQHINKYELKYLIRIRFNSK